MPCFLSRSFWIESRLTLKVRLISRERLHLAYTRVPLGDKFKKISFWLFLTVLKPSKDTNDPRDTVQVIETP